MDAVGALPERLRLVVIGYFFEERSMQDLADELGVSESRISQLRAEALLLLRDGVNSQLEPDALPDEPRPNGRVAVPQGRATTPRSPPDPTSAPGCRTARSTATRSSSAPRSARSAAGNRAAERKSAHANQHVEEWQRSRGNPRGADIRGTPRIGRRPTSMPRSGSEIANLQVSSQNVTASDSHVAGTEMSAEMRAYTESQMPPRAAANAAPKAILELLQ